MEIKDEGLQKAGITRRKFLGINASVATTMLSAQSNRALGRSARRLFGRYSPKFTLASSGKSFYVIVVGPRAGETESFAARELQDYLRRITRAALPITTAPRSSPFLSVGDCPAAESVSVPSRYPGDDSFRMLVRDENIILKGAIPRATLYAVYAFLERLGCWWFAPQTAVFQNHAELVPSRPTLVLEPFDITEQPFMKYRIQDADQARGLTKAEDWRALIAWMAKNRSNTLAMFLENYEANRATIAQELTRRGMRGEVGKHLVTIRFLSPDQYFRSHPDWYGMIAGKRTTQAGRHPVMFETANPQAVAMFTKNVIVYLKDRQEIHTFQLWPPDGCVWSESPEALALGSPSERMALLVQHVARAIGGAGLNTRVELLAYQAYTEPPKNMNFSEETIVDFCPISRNYSVPFEDPDSPVNRKLDGFLREWSARFPGEVREYTYYAKYSWCSLPVALPAQIGHDMKYWHGIGETGASIYSEPNNWLSLEVNHLAFMRALWDRHFAPVEWYERYLRARFGDAANAMKRFYSLSAKISLGALIAQSLSGNASDYRLLVAQAKRAMQEALRRAGSSRARWAVQKVAWEAAYLDIALKLREAEVAHEEASKVQALENRLEELTARHANDGTYLPYPFWLLSRRRG